MITDWLELKDKRYELNNKGYLLNMSQWNEDILKWFADQEAIDLSPDHHIIIMILRGYFSEHNLHPAVRTITSAMTQSLGPEKANLKYFHKLFPGGIHQSFKIAGLPMQDSCC